ncbi:hypothetical protein ACHAQJ_000108 [Trichoderma viride]
MGDTGDFVRLHITPLDTELVKVVIPASLQPVARNISYHTIETFPEKRYGFVELPEADAEKLRKKLNGTTLKGCKMRVEKARPEARIEPTGEEDEIPDKKKKSSKDGKKRKREPDVLEGVALHDRQVKRGWTETPTTNKRKNRKDKESKDKEKEKEKRKRLKSKYTEGEECLLKTKLPPNTMKNLAPEELEHKKRSKKKGSSRLVVIHEFEKTTKFPSFLKASVATDRKNATEYAEGKGWVDEEGNVVEEVKEKEKPKASHRPKKTPKPKQVPEEPEDDSTDDSGTSSEGTSSEDESEEESEEEVEAEVSEEEPKAPPTAASKVDNKEKEDDGNTSSDDSSESDTSDAEEEQSLKAAEQTTPTSSSKASGSKSTPGSTKPLAIKIPPPETPVNTKVHPLEALYKRPKPSGEEPTSAPKEELFSFFEAGEEEEEEEEEVEPSEATPANPPPMTPFTRQDYEWRNIRSAAPTPDTAHPTRMRFWGASPEKDVDMEDSIAYDQQEEEEEEEEENEDEGSPAQGKHSATTDFQKWFWENRRDLNKSWMTRRKTAAKDKRHRENKARASKAV